MALFKDLLKKWFYTNSSSAASSDARVPLLDASGNPKGSDTMANLASVLGVGDWNTGAPADSYETLESIPTGVYCFTQSKTYLPSGIGSYSTLAMLGDFITARIAILTSPTGNDVYINRVFSGQANFRGWIKIVGTAV